MNDSTTENSNTTTEWHVIEKKRQAGPISELELSDLIRDCKFTRKASVWNSELPEWQPILQSQFAPEFGQPPRSRNVSPPVSGDEASPIGPSAQHSLQKKEISKTLLTFLCRFSDIKFCILVGFVFIAINLLLTPKRAGDNGKLLYIRPVWSSDELISNKSYHVQQKAIKSAKREFKILHNYYKTDKPSSPLAQLDFETFIKMMYLIDPAICLELTGYTELVKPNYKKPVIDFTILGMIVFVELFLIYLAHYVAHSKKEKLQEALQDITPNP